MNTPKEPTDKTAPDQPTPETAEARVARIYKAPGGPLMGWLEDEARRRNQTAEDMADALGVTYGYVVQLHRGIRTTVDLSRPLVQSCARYLGVPAIVVKLVAGIIDIRDFAFPYETEEQQVERALRCMLDDPKVRASMPVRLDDLPLEAKKAIVLLHAESNEQDVFRVRHLPTILRWLQRAAMEHNESELEAYRSTGVTN